MRRPSLASLLLVAACSSGPGTSTGTASTAGDAPAATSTTACPAPSTATTSAAASAADPRLDFGADHYWVRILGTPAATGLWTVQYGGHHLALNATVDGADMTLAPTLWGAQPSSYESAGTSAEPLCGETTKAFALIDALDPGQQKAAVLTTPVGITHIHSIYREPGNDYGAQLT